MSGLILKHINKIYPGGQQAIRDFNLEMKESGILVLSGPDGCGKSTLIRMIAGLEEITSGTLFINGEDMTHTEPRERNVAMIFRNSVLYPHLTVRENLTFALRMAKFAPAEIDKRVEEIASDLNLGSLLEKMPEELNTIQVYQVLLGRALIRKPSILLMDSTIADLDEGVQAVIREKFVELQKKMNLMVIYVTENQKSAMAVGSRMIIMSDGEICQDDTPAELFARPATSYVAGVVGYPPMNFFIANVYEDGGRVGLSFKKGKVLLSEEKGKILLEKGKLKKEVLVGLRADALVVRGGKKKAEEGELTCKVLGMETIYSRPMLRFAMDETQGICLADEMPAGGEGSTVILTVNAEKMQIFDRETDKTIVY